jgi:glycosyltransferase involved in cell wall biosynthesis
MNNNENIEKINLALNRLEESKSIVYFLTYDTKNNARASVKYIYDLALTLNQNGIVSKILVEDRNYTGVNSWLGDKYDELPVVSIKDDKIEINIDDTIVVPEYYTNTLQQLSNIKCIKVLLVQQKEYIYENLPIGSRFSDYGFDRIITTTNESKKYLLEYFPESLVFVIPPIIEDIFEPSTSTIKPFIAISVRDRSIQRKLISEFYLKFPQLRWITFRDMVQMTYEDFSKNLKECMVSLWVDDDSTFGTFPLESMKSGVPVVGKIPNTEPDWLSENGLWTYDSSKLVEILGTYILAWIEGVELTEEVKDKMKETLLPYKKEVTENNILSVFNSFKNKRMETFKITLEKLKQEENA